MAPRTPIPLIQVDPALGGVNQTKTKLHNRCACLPGSCLLVTPLYMRAHGSATRPRAAHTLASTGGRAWWRRAL